MQINSEKAIAQARRDFRRYGSNWFNVFAAATRGEDGILRLPREAAPEPAAAEARGVAKTGD